MSLILSRLDVARALHFDLSPIEERDPLTVNKRFPLIRRPLIRQEPELSVSQVASSSSTRISGSHRRASLPDVHSFLFLFSPRTADFLALRFRPTRPLLVGILFLPRHRLSYLFARQSLKWIRVCQIMTRSLFFRHVCPVIPSLSPSVRSLSSIKSPG